MNDADEMAEHTEVEFPEDTRLFNIAFWCGTISWLVLILGLLTAILDLVRMYRNGFFTPIEIQLHPIETIVMLLAYAQPVLTPIILWFFLQALKEFLFLMIDIKESMLSDTQES